MNSGADCVSLVGAIVLRPLSRALKSGWAVVGGLLIGRASLQFPEKPSLPLFARHQHGTSRERFGHPVLERGFDRKETVQGVLIRIWGRYLGQ